MTDIFKRATQSELRLRRIHQIMNVCPKDFLRIIGVIGDIRFTRKDIKIKKSHPHLRKLLVERMCVSVFLWNYESMCLKVAKVRTQEELNKQYNPKIRGSLAKAVLKRMPSLGSRHVSGWIRSHTDRFDFIISKKYGNDILTLLETFLRIILSPHY